VLAGPEDGVELQVRLVVIARAVVVEEDGAREQRELRQVTPPPPILDGAWLRPARHHLPAVGRKRWQVEDRLLQRDGRQGVVVVLSRQFVAVLPRGLYGHDPRLRGDEEVSLPHLRDAEGGGVQPPRRRLVPERAQQGCGHVEEATLLL